MAAASDVPNQKKWAAGLTMASSVIGILVGLNTLTTPHQSSSPPPTATPTTASPWAPPVYVPPAPQYVPPVPMYIPPYPTTETPPPPSFSVNLVQWNGPCNRYVGCSMKATFTNNGGPGGGSARFFLKQQGTNATLATCDTVIVPIQPGNSSTTGCAANCPWLQQYLSNHPRQQIPVWIHVQSYS